MRTLFTEAGDDTRGERPREFAHYNGAMMLRAALIVLVCAAPALSRGPRRPPQKAAAGAIVRVGAERYRVEILDRHAVVHCTDSRYVCVLDRQGAGHIFDRLRPALDRPVRLPVTTTGIDAAGNIATAATQGGKACEVIDITTGKRRAGPFPVPPPWGFTLGAKGRYLYPHRTEGSRYYYFDLANNKILYHDILQRRFHYEWSCAVDLGDRKFCVFAVGVKKDRILSANPEDFLCRRAVWSRDDPGRFEVAAFRWPVTAVIGRDGDSLVLDLAHLTRGLVDTKRWKVGKTWRPAPGLAAWNTHRGPQGRWWSIDNHRGVQLRTQRGGKVLWESRAGAPGNANSLGVIFLPGDVGLVAAPYKQRLAMVSTRGQPSLIGILELDVPASGAFPIAPAKKGEPGRLLVVKTMLPYE